MRIICILLIRLIRQEPARLRIILRVFLEIRTLFFRTEGVQQTVKTAVYSRVKALHVGFSICWIARRLVYSRHASPLEVYFFVAVDERGEHVMSDEICRRCNGERQGRRRGGRSVQLPDSFLILHSSSRHTCTCTYVLYVRPNFNIFSGTKRNKAPSEVRSRDGNVLFPNFRVYLSDVNGVDSKFCAKNMRVLRSYLWLLGFSVG